MATNARIRAAHLVASNWRIRDRLPRTTRLAISLGYCDRSIPPDRGDYSNVDRPVDLTDPVWIGHI
jgi:hypothetical protein